MSGQSAGLRGSNFVWLTGGILFGLAISYFWPSEVAVASTDRDSGGKFAIITCEAQALSPSPDIVFVLDFLTGRLTGASIDIQTGKFSQYYQRNIAADFNLSPEAQAKYIITNGQLNLTGRGSALPAKDGIFIAELTSGLVNCYSFVYNQNARGGGALMPIVPQAQFSFRQAMNP